MTTVTQSHKGNISIWKRFFAFIQAMEEASDYTPAERSVTRLDQKVSELEDTIRDLENGTQWAG